MKNKIHKEKPNLATAQLTKAGTKGLLFIVIYDSFTTKKLIQDNFFSIK